jgi:hypothetical protein
MRVRLDGVCWRLDTGQSPSPWVRCDDRAVEAPLALYPALYRLAERKNAMKAGKKPPGRKRKPKGASRPEQMLADLHSNGFDFEATAKRFNVKPKTVEDKIRKLRQ